MGDESLPYRLLIVVVGRPRQQTREWEGVKNDKEMPVNTRDEGESNIHVIYAKTQSHMSTTPDLSQHTAPRKDKTTTTTTTTSNTALSPRFIIPKKSY